MLLRKKTKTFIDRLSNMISLTNLPDMLVAEVTEIEQMQLLIINAIDDLEQMARARELTNIIWDINVNSNKTDEDWRKTEILLESYEKLRDEALESALSNLKELADVVEISTNVSTLPNLSLQDMNQNKDAGLNIGMSA